MKKVINSYFFEVWFSNGETAWNYSLHELMKIIREKKNTCVLMYRCDYTNSVVVPVLSFHELNF